MLINYNHKKYILKIFPMIDRLLRWVIISLAYLKSKPVCSRFKAENALYDPLRIPLKAAGHSAESGRRRSFTKSVF